MRCVEDGSAAELAAHAWAFLDREPALHNVICTLVEAACVDGSDPHQRWIRILAERGDRDSDADAQSDTDADGDGEDNGRRRTADRFRGTADRFRGEDRHGDELVGVAVQTRPYGPLLSEMPEPAARAVAEHLARTHADLTSVNGPSAAASTFARHYAAILDGTADLVMSQRLLRLDRVRHPRGVPGGPRVATPADRDLVVAWMRAFSVETLPHGGRDVDEDALVDRRFTYPGLMWFWEVDGVPVSFAWRSPLLGPERWPSTNVVRVSAVYTPHEQRGHGYASANVAALSQRCLDEGATACMLYTDAANPTSNKIYEQIGYRLIGTAAQWQLS
jgi:predicted GNAT family acetyltransferase